MSCSIAGIYNMVCDQGATLDRPLTWTDSRKKPHDLLNFTARMQIRTSVNSPDVILELTTENDRITLLGPVDYNIRLFIDAETTARLIPGTYVYDLELVSDSGIVDRLIEGNFKVKGNVTR